MRMKIAAAGGLIVFALCGSSLVARAADGNAAALASVTDSNAPASATATNAVAAPLKTAAEIFDFSSGKLASYKTWSGDVVQTMNMMGREMTSSGTIIQKQPRRMRVMMDVPMGGQTVKMNMVLGGDGIMWQESGMPGAPRVIKMDMVKVLSNVAARTGMKIDPLKAMDPSQQWSMNKEMMDYTLKGVQDLGGQPMYVLNGVWKQSALTNQEIASVAAYLGKSVVYVGAEDGFIHRFEQYAADGKTRVVAMEFTNLKFNQDVPDDVFKYQPPADAQVQDVTDAASQPAQVPPPQGSPTPQPSTPAPVPSYSP